MSEWKIILLLTAGPLLWALGGTIWKGWRRFVWPAVAGLLTSSIWVVPAMILSNILPYGDRTPGWLKAIVFLAISSIGIVINLNSWPVTLAGWLLICGAFMATKKLFWFTHKIFEAVCGFVQAVAVITARLM